MMDLQRFSSSSELQTSAAKIASEYKTTIYDASYVALSQSLSCQLVTADRKLYRKVKSLEFVKLLGRG